MAPDFREPLNIIVTGVGGQGNVLASKLLATAAVEAGCRVAVGETFGVSQRGGSVMSHVRISRSKAYGPLIPLGAAHLVAGLEPLETLRVLGSYAGVDTQVIMNDRPNYPLACLSGAAAYPDVAEMVKAAAGLSARTTVIPASELAARAGSLLAANTVLVGALAGSGLLPLCREHFLAALDTLFQGSIKELNTRAFLLGLEWRQEEGRQ